MIRLNITQNGKDGEGVAKLDGKVFFVQNTRKGDEVLAIIEKENKNFCIASRKQILKPSPYRCNAVCKYYGECGGCNLQHAVYQKQLEIKTSNVQNLFNVSLYVAVSK